MTEVTCLSSSADKSYLLELLGNHFHNPRVLRETVELIAGTDATAYITDSVIVITTPMDWDSRHYGFPIGRLVPLVQPKATPKGILSDFGAIAKHLSSWHLLCVRIAVTETLLIHAVEATGFRIMDQLVTFKGPTQTTDSAGAEGIHRVRSLTQEQLVQIREMSAGTFIHSRFYSDRRFDRTRVDDMYGRWADSVLHTGDLFVAEENGRVAGYVACVSEGSDAHIQLISVAASFRGRGIGRALVSHVKNHYAGQCRHVVVGTQLANTPAMALYASCGLLPVRAELSFHRWVG